MRKRTWFNYCHVCKDEFTQTKQLVEHLNKHTKQQLIKQLQKGIIDHNWHG